MSANPTFSEDKSRAVFGFFLITSVLLMFVLSICIFLQCRNRIRRKKCRAEKRKSREGMRREGSTGTDDQWHPQKRSGELWMGAGGRMMVMGGGTPREAMGGAEARMMRMAMGGGKSSTNESPGQQSHIFTSFSSLDSS